MINITIIEEDESGLINKFIVEGHAGYAEKGKDIVCAAVSSLVIATVRAIKCRQSAVIVEHDGYLSCMIETPNFATNCFVKVLREGAMGLQEEYSDFVKLHRIYV